MAMVMAAAPLPTLGETARQARQNVRAQKRESSHLRQVGRKVMAMLALCFAMLGIGGGTAQAWPWDVAENVTAYISNFCGPNDVRDLTTAAGMDTSVGLNVYEESSVRNTIVPKADAAGGQGDGLGRIDAAYKAAGDAEKVIHPTYERYGLSALKWTNYGSGCFTVGHWATPFVNMMLTAGVHLPFLMGMAVLNIVLPDQEGDLINVVMNAFITPFVGPVVEIFLPWAYFLAPLGVFWAWVRSKGSLQATSKAAVWVMAMVGTMMFLQFHNSTLISQANSVVVKFTGSAAQTITEVNQAPGGDYPGARQDGNHAIRQNLWYGGPYQTWLIGEVGPVQAAEDIKREQAGNVGWGPAILNGMYLGSTGADMTLDEAAKAVQGRSAEWNSHSYAPEVDGFIDKAETKVSDWNDHGIYNDVPFLLTVGALCNDGFSGGGDDKTGPDANRWMYGGSCDDSGAGTQDLIPYFQGHMFQNQVLTAANGALAGFFTNLVIVLVGAYLGFQRLMFGFLLIVAPIFLAVATVADEKRRRFATRFFELLASNVVKQAAAVLGLLFFANTLSSLLGPSNEAMMLVPAFLRAHVALFFVLGVLALMIPVAGIAKAAVKGDASVVDKTAKFPVTAVKKTAVLAGATGLTLATAGATAGVLGGTAGRTLASGKAGRVLTAAGRMAGNNKAGKALRKAGGAVRMGNQVAGFISSEKTAKDIRRKGVQAMLGGPDGEDALTKIGAQGGLSVGSNGVAVLNRKGYRLAEKMYEDQTRKGLAAGQAEKAQQAHMAGFFKNHREAEGLKAARAAGLNLDNDGRVLDPKAAAAAGVSLDAAGRPVKHHALDPDAPWMRARAQEVKAARTADTQRAAAMADGRRTAAEQAAAGDAPVVGEGTPGRPNGDGADKYAALVPAGIPTDKNGLPMDPALAEAVRAGIRLNADGTVEDVARARAAGVHLDSEGRPLTAAAAAAAGTVAQSDNVRTPADEAARLAQEESRKGFADEARDKFEGPAFAQDQNVRADVVQKGDDVLAAAGMTREDAAANPGAFLASGAYADGDLAKMDPRHPATAALNDLRFAATHGTEAEQDAASQRAAEAILAHGVPDEVSSVHTVGESAEKFVGAQVVGAMPTTTPDTPWQERAESAATMAAVAATMPKDHPAAPAVQEYVSALSNPSVSAEEVADFKERAIHAFDGGVEETANADQGATVVVPAVVGAAVGGAATGAGGGDFVDTPRAAVPLGAAGVGGPQDGETGLSEATQDKVQALNEQARAASEAYGQSGDSEANLAAFNDAAARAPMFNDDVQNVQERVAALPQNHPAQAAYNTYLDTSLDSGSTPAERAEALAAVETALAAPATGLNEAAAVGVASLNEQARVAQDVAASPEATEVDRANAVRAQEVAPAFNAEARQVQDAVAAVPQDHPAQAAYASYVDTALDSESTPEARADALAAVNTALTVPATGLAPEVASNVAALNEQARVAQVAAAAPDATEVDRANALQMQEVAPAFNAEARQVQDAVAAVPQDHPAQAAYAAYIETAANPEATIDQREAAHAGVMTALTQTGAPLEAAEAAPVAAVPVVGPSEQVPSMERVAAEAPAFAQSVASRAEELGALPLEATMGQSLGYTTTIGGQDYTSGSRAPLDALNNHAEQVMSAVTIGDAGTPTVDTSFADQGLQERLSMVGAQYYGAVSVPEGQDAPEGMVTAQVAGQTFAAPAQENLDRFAADVNTFGGTGQGFAGTVDGQVMEPAQYAVAAAATQHHVDTLAASSLAAAMGGEPIAEQGGHAPAQTEALAAAMPVFAVQPGQVPTYAQSATSESIAEIGEDNYGVQPVRGAVPAEGWHVATVAGQAFMAESPERLEEFAHDVREFAGSAAMGMPEEHVMESATPAQRDLFIAGSSYFHAARVEQEAGTQADGQDAYEPPTGAVYSDRDFDRQDDQPFMGGNAFQDAPSVVGDGEGPTFSAPAESAPERPAFVTAPTEDFPAPSAEETPRFETPQEAVGAYRAAAFEAPAPSEAPTTQPFTGTPESWSMDQVSETYSDAATYLRSAGYPSDTYESLTAPEQYEFPEVPEGFNTAPGVAPAPYGPASPIRAQVAAPEPGEPTYAQEEAPADTPSDGGGYTMPTYEVPAHERDEYQVLADQAGAYRAERVDGGADYTSGPSFADAPSEGPAYSPSFVDHTPTESPSVEPHHSAPAETPSAGALSAEPFTEGPAVEPLSGPSYDERPTAAPFEAPSYEGLNAEPLAEADYADHTSDPAPSPVAAPVTLPGLRSGKDGQSEGRTAVPAESADVTPQSTPTQPKVPSYEVPAEHRDDYQALSDAAGTYRHEQVASDGFPAPTFAGSTSLSEQTDASLYYGDDRYEDLANEGRANHGDGFRRVREEERLFRQEEDALRRQEEKARKKAEAQLKAEANRTKADEGGQGQSNGESDAPIHGPSGEDEGQGNTWRPRRRRKGQHSGWRENADDDNLEGDDA